MATIRAAGEADYPAFAELFRELGIDDPTPSRERWARDLAGGTLVDDRAGTIVGYINFYKLATAGHVRNLVVAPGARRGGVGRGLMAAAAARLRSAGAIEWHLNVKAENRAAIALYESLAMTIEHRSTVMRIAWSEIARAAGEPAVASLVDRSDDAELERTFGLLGGRIAMSRERADRVIVQLRDDSCAPVGLACFDPAIPGVYPFCVTRPELAWTLLAALRTYARPGEQVQLVIEDDPPLVAALAARGAETRMQLVHYRGAL